MAYDFSKLKVLLVEDDHSMRYLVRDVLKAFGVGEIEWATDGTAAYEVLDRYAADMVIADWQMAPMNGLDFLRKVRLSSDSPNPFVPMIMLTGYTDAERVKACRDAGVTSYLAKPVTPKALYTRIVSVIEDKRPFVRTENYFGPDLGDAIPLPDPPKKVEGEAVFEF